MIQSGIEKLMLLTVVGPFQIRERAWYSWKKLKAILRGTLRLIFIDYILLKLCDDFFTRQYNSNFACLLGSNCMAL